MNYSMCLLILCATIVTVRCCVKDAECPVADTVCLEGVCSCKKGFLLNADNTQCLPYVTEYYGECSEDAQCEWLGENSECKYVCLCKEGYRWYQGKCIAYAGLGGKCSDSIDCFDGYDLLSLTCVSETCTCSDGYYQRGDTDCRKIASSGDICALNLDCVDPDTECHVGKCLSPAENASKDLEQIEEIEQTSFPYQATDEQTPCDSDADCAEVKNSECYPQTGTCICKKQYFFDQESGDCIAELGVDVGCKADSDCPLRPGKCVDGVCYCRDYYFVDAGNRNCVKTISENNWNCLSREWCYALGSYSYCSSAGTCNCSSLADFDAQKEICVWNGETDPDICSSDVECQYVRNSFCIDEHCGCLPDYIVEGDTCLPRGGLGGACETQNDCQVDHTECLDHKCQCVENYAAFEDNCYMIKYNLGDECEVDVECSAGISGSVCGGGKCECSDRYTPYNNICYEKKDYGSYCNNRLECSLSLSEKIGDNVMCRNHKCQCPTAYTFEDNKCSSGSILIGNVLVVATVMILKRVF